LIIILALLFSVIVQILYYLIVFCKAAFNKPAQCELSKLQPVSVIIAAKNEAENLKNNLPKILNQNHPNFEVIVIDDASSDKTRETLAEFKKKYKNLKILHTDKSKGKKHALTIAINESKHELLLFTDADCYPISNNWIKRMTSLFSESKDIVLGYGAYRRDSSILSKFIAYDTFMIMMQYFGAAMIGKAYMGVGRNLSYKKQIWVKNNGFYSHKDIITGDDDLFIREVSTKDNTIIADDYDSITISEPEKNYKDFIKQKRRHISGAKKYNFTNKLLSGGELLSRALFYISIILTIIIVGIIPAIAAFLIVWIVKIVVINKLALKFKDSSIFFHALILDIFAILVYFNIWIKPKKRFSVI